MWGGVFLHWLQWLHLYDFWIDPRQQQQQQQQQQHRASNKPECSYKKYNTIEIQTGDKSTQKRLD